MAITTSPTSTRSLPEQRVGLHHPDPGGGQVVLVRGHHPRVLRGLPTQQRAAGHLAAEGDPAADVGHPLRLHLTTGDVVEQEQRLGAAGDDVVDHHRDQIQADRVVHVHGLGDQQLRAHPVGGGGQHRVAVLRDVRRNRPAKPPRPPITSGRWARLIFVFSSSTACSPAWMETPASAYVTVRLRLPRPLPALQRLAGQALGRPFGVPSALGHMRHVSPLGVAAASRAVARCPS